MNRVEETLGYLEMRGAQPLVLEEMLALAKQVEHWRAIPWKTAGERLFDTTGYAWDYQGRIETFTLYLSINAGGAWTDKVAILAYAGRTPIGYSGRKRMRSAKPLTALCKTVRAQQYAKARQQEQRRHQHYLRSHKQTLDEATGSIRASLR